MLTILFHKDCARHDMGPFHPESSQRILKIQDAIQHLPGIKILEPPMATREQLALAHDTDYIDSIFSQSPVEGTVSLETDTSMNPFSLRAALYAAGAAVYAIELVMTGKSDQVFCNVRPPGHHAEHNKALGFCLFNNIAVGAKFALEQHKINRVAIVDFDVHHGNGTEDILKNDSRVMLCSLFQHPHYPFSPLRERHPRILHLPLEAGTGGSQMREQVQKLWLSELEAFRPELILFSAGFDAHAADPLASLRFHEEDYAWLTCEVMKATHSSSKGRAISCLEGGYNLDALTRSALSHLDALRFLQKSGEK